MQQPEHRDTMSGIRTARGNSLTQYLYSKASRLRIPISGTFELSPVCNFSCRMCYVRKTRQEVACSPRGILTLDDWRKIAQELLEVGTLSILLTGGEPLLWPDFWTLYEELIDMGFQVSVNTNGSLIDEDALLRFRRRPPHHINITLYGASDETYHRLCAVRGVFSRVDNAIRSLKAIDIPVRINCSLTPENAHDLEWIVSYARELGAQLSVATYMFPPVRRDPGSIGRNERFTPEESADYLMHFLRLNRGEERYRKYLQEIRSGCAEPPGLDESCYDPADGKVRCRAGKASFWITWDGWLTPCGMMPEPRTELRGRSFADAWRELVELTAALRLSKVCESCPNQSICHSCAALAYAETGSFSGIPTYMCRAAQQMRRIAREDGGSHEPHPYMPTGNGDTSL